MTSFGKFNEVKSPSILLAFYRSSCKIPTFLDRILKFVKILEEGDGNHPLQNTIAPFKRADASNLKLNIHDGDI